ncbi:MAG: DUF2306 domain-containing protein [Pseudonocardia sp.]|nr:DUF2306 domain-containing protein [Pseudonocardia sp.]
MTETSGAARRTRLIGAMCGARPRLRWSILALLIAVVLVSFAIRLAVDVPNIVTGTVPGPDAFEQRYALHPAAAYLHMVPGVVYLLGAPLQLSRRFRSQHLRAHRRLGRVVLAAGLITGVAAIVVGVWFPYGGTLEASGAVVFGAWFLAALVLAYRAVRRRDIARHRRFMIRAFAVGLAVGTTRVWVGLFQAVGLLAIQNNAGTQWFGVAFWFALVMHAVLAEAYLAARPTVIGRTNLATS